MADPVVQVTVDKAVVAPGEGNTVRTAVTDSDDKMVTVTVEVTDSTGNIGTGSKSFPVKDQHTYAGSADFGLMTQDTADPSVFHWTES